jgi:hypothetical protein
MSCMSALCHVGHLYVMQISFMSCRSALYLHGKKIVIPPLPEGGGRYTVLLLSFHPSKIFFVAFFSVTIDGRNLIFGQKRYIGIPYCGKRFWTRQIPTSCLPT